MIASTTSPPPVLRLWPSGESRRLRRQRGRDHGDRAGRDSGDDLVLECEQRGLGWRRSVLDAVLNALKVAPSVNGVGRSVANRTTIRDQRRDPADDDGILECRWQALASTRLAGACSERIVEHDHPSSDGPGLTLRRWRVGAGCDAPRRSHGIHDDGSGRATKWPNCLRVPNEPLTYAVAAHAMLRKARVRDRERRQQLLGTGVRGVDYLRR